MHSQSKIEALFQAEKRRDLRQRKKLKISTQSKTIEKLHAIFEVALRVGVLHGEGLIPNEDEVKALALSLGELSRSLSQVDERGIVAIEAKMTVSVIYDILEPYKILLSNILRSQYLREYRKDYVGLFTLLKASMDDEVAKDVRPKLKSVMNEVKGDPERPTGKLMEFLRSYSPKSTDIQSEVKSQFSDKPETQQTKVKKVVRFSEVVQFSEFKTYMPEVKLDGSGKPEIPPVSTTPRDYGIGFRQLSKTGLATVAMNSETPLFNATPSEFRYLAPEDEIDLRKLAKISLTAMAAAGAWYASPTLFGRSVARQALSAVVATQVVQKLIP